MVQIHPHRHLGGHAQAGMQNEMSQVHPSNTLGSQQQLACRSEHRSSSINVAPLSCLGHGEVLQKPEGSAEEDMQKPAHPCNQSMPTCADQVSQH